MTTLKCSATTCMYNKEQLCSKGDIDVTGENATTANETSCGSFRERSGNSVTNSCASGCGCEKIRSTVKHTTVPIIQTANVQLLPFMWTAPAHTMPLIPNATLFSAAVVSEFIQSA